jgi:polar amino acid transport system permease protein
MGEQTYWDWEFALSIAPQLIDAMWVTLAATLVGFTIAIVVGLIMAIGRRSQVRVLSTVTGGIIEFIRSTPLLVQVYFIYYSLPFYGITLSPFIAGALGLGIHYGTYLSEVYRSGIEAVPKAQWEASTALNFSTTQTWTRIILPQAIPPVIPVFGNYLITMFKETPLLSAITLVEMLQTAKIIGAMNFKYLEAITIVGLLFFLLSYPSGILVRRLEAKLNRRS